MDGKRPAFRGFEASPAWKGDGMPTRRLGRPAWDTSKTATQKKRAKMTKFKKITGIALAGCMALSSLMMTAGAASVLSENATEIINNSSLPNAQAQAVWQEARGSLIASHSGVYALENFSAAFTGSGYDGINLDVTADSTLLLNPETNRYFEGMRSALNTLDEGSREAAQPIYDAQFYDAMQAYQTP